MSRHIDLGYFPLTEKPFRADLDIVLRSNALVQANSGGGKSWTLRRMIEQAFRRVPQIIIDPEGEFSTLRTKFDLVLVGKGGDTPADIRSAPLLAHRLLELGASAVVDLFEMSKAQRPLWVATFIQALVDAPKKLWRDLLVYVDEAHELAPEAGHGVNESRDEKLCRHALIDLAAKGRKRGYGVVAATQRLGKLSKDFAAELKNVLIGQTFIDIDRERAAGSLGIAKANKSQFFIDVKTLAPGSFFALGRAFCLDSALVTIGGVETEHPEAGRRQSAPPPPTEKIRHLLPQLADLPKEAEQKVQTEKELRVRIAELERELAKKAPVTPPAKTPERAIISIEKDIKRLERLTEKLEQQEGRFKEIGLAALDVARDRLAQAQQTVVSEVGSLRTVLAKNAVQLVGPPINGSVVNGTSASVGLGRQVARARAGAQPADPNGEHQVSRCARALLAVLAQRGHASDSQLSALSGYRKTSSGFTNSLSELRVKGLIDSGSPDRRAITQAGRDRAGPTEPLPSGRALFDYWRTRLSKAEAAILDVVYRHQTASRDAISSETGYSLTSSGFTNAISGLRTLDLIYGPNGGDLTIADVFRE